MLEDVLSGFVFRYVGFVKGLLARNPNFSSAFLLLE